MKKIISIIFIIIGITGCHNVNQEKKSILSENQFSIAYCYNQFSDNHACLLAFLIKVNDENINVDDIRIDIEGVDKVGNINEELTADPKYTSDYFQKKVFLDKNNKYIIKYYVIDTELDFNDSNAYEDSFDVVIQYQDNKIVLQQEATVQI